MNDLILEIPICILITTSIILSIIEVTFIWKTPEFINNYIKSRKKEIPTDEPIEIFANFDSNSTIRYYSIEQGDQKVKINSDSRQLAIDIKECLENKEISWSDMSGKWKSTIREDIKKIKEERIVNKIKL